MKKLIFIHYAGGNAGVFNAFIEEYMDGVDCYCIEYPGRGARSSEMYAESFDALTEDVARQVNALIDDNEEYYLLGYSMGSVVAFEMIARGLLKCNPVHLLLAAHESPSRRWKSQEAYKLSDEEFMEFIKGFGGVEGYRPKMLKTSLFRSVILMPMRKDYELLADYTYRDNKQIDIPVTMFYSDADISGEKVQCWNEVLKGGAEYIELGNSHFLIKEVPDELARFIKERIK